MAARSGLGYELRVVILLGLAYGFAFYDRMTMSFLGPIVQGEFHLANWQIGALQSGLSLTWAIGAYVFGRWSDATGTRKPFLLAAMLIFSICSALSGLTTSFWPLFATRVGMGAVEGPFLPVCLAIIAAASPPQRRGLNSGIVQNFFGSLLGNSLAPILVVWIAVNWGWRTSFFTAGIPGLILALLIWRFIDEAPAAPRVMRQPGEDHGRGVLAMLRHRNIILCSLISCLCVGSLVLGSTFLPIYLVKVRHFEPTMMSKVMAVLGICPALGGPLVTWISDRVGRRLPLILFSLLMTLCPLAALLYPGDVYTLTALMFVGWIGIGCFPLFMGVVPAETLNYRNAAAAMGVVVAIGELTGGVVAPLVTGWLADHSTVAVPIAVQAAMSVIAAGIALALRETNPAVLDRATARPAAA